MLYTPKYIQNNDLDKTICECGECKKYRILYCHTNVVEDVEKKVVENDVIGICSKCKRMYRFSIKHTVFGNENIYNVGKINTIKESYEAVRENIQKNYNSFNAVHTIKSDNYLTKLIKEENEQDSAVLEYVFMEK